MKPLKKDIPILGIQGIINQGEKTGQDGEQQEDLIKFIDSDGNSQ